MSELLARGTNVAIPEVDVGEDVFAFEDGFRPVDRIQVKSANAKTLKTGYSADVSVEWDQISSPDDPELFYVFAIRLENRWVDFVVISRADIYDLHQNQDVGHRNRKAGQLQLHFSFTPFDVDCSNVSLKEYRNAWGRLPVRQLRTSGSPVSPGPKPAV